VVPPLCNSSSIDLSLSHQQASKLNSTIRVEDPFFPFGLMKICLRNNNKPMEWTWTPVSLSLPLPTVTKYVSGTITNLWTYRKIYPGIGDNHTTTISK